MLCSKPCLQHLCRLTIVLVILMPVGSSAWSSANNFQASQPSQYQIGQRVQLLIQRTVQLATIKLTDGTSATVMPVTPTRADAQEVTDYGDPAVKVLAGYLSSKSPMEQHVAFRFLAECRSDLAFEAIQAFAEKSAFAAVRQEATVDLGSFPETKVRSILERISTGDPNVDVRTAARRALTRFQASQGAQKR